MGTFNYYRAGQVNGQGAVLYIFRFLRADGSFGSCMAVEEQDAAKERDALIAMGWRFRA